MCGIVDANVAFEVFGDVGKHTEAGTKFFDWISAGSGRLVVGGQLLRELHTPTREWARQLLLASRMTIVDKDAVDMRTTQLRREESCKSNDPHVIALAQISGARLLYTDDADLMRDFKNRSLINNPRGKVYPARGDGSVRDGTFGRVHQRLLKQKNLCGP